MIFCCFALASVLSCLLKYRFGAAWRRSQLAVTYLVPVTLLCNFSGIAAAQAKTATSTSLVISSQSHTVSSVTAGSVVTLTAHVNAGGTAVTPGQVNFCDASATFCTDIHLLGTAQLTAAGIATFSFRPSIGKHIYKAVFAGTKTYNSSASTASALTGTGTIPALATTTAINQTGGWGAYTLSSTVTETGNTASPTGTISFLDTNHGNAMLGTGSLGTATRDVAFSNVDTSAPNLAGVTTVVSDLNGDGIPDLFIKDYFGTYNVLLGKGDGTFSIGASAFGPSSQTGSFIVGDFNNDGIPDVAAINSTYLSPTNSLTIFLGKGDGTFTVSNTSPAVGMNPSAITTADVNGDGNADLVVCQMDSSGAGQILVFAGDGHGGFTQSSSITSLSSTVSTMIPVDVNNDGKVDLVVNGLNILLGGGDGSFTAASGPAQAGAAFAVADVNNDGVPDLVFLEPGTSYLDVYLGNGDGTFNAAPAGPTANLRIYNPAIGDFNQDGVPDIAYALPNNTGIGLLYGKGDGTFVQSSATTSYGYDFESNFEIGDFNGDGWPDVLAVDLGGRTVEDSLTQPTETATASATVAIAAAGSHLAAASYPGDSHYNASKSGTIPLWGDPPTTATSLTITSGGKTVSSVSTGSAVTLTAMVTAGGSAVTFGQVSFCDASAPTCSDIHLLGSATLSNAGTATFKFVPGPGTHSYVAVFPENGYGLSSTSAAASLTVGPAPAVVYSDTAAISYSGSPGNYSLTATVVGYGGSAVPSGNISFLDTSFGNTVLGTAPVKGSTAGIGSIVSQISIPGQQDLSSQLTGDFNGDGIPDLAVLGTDNIYGNSPFTITILFGKGDGTFTTGPYTQLANSVSVVDIMAGDFNDDGKEDIVVLTDFLSNSGPTVLSLLGKGDGTFTVTAASTVVLPNQGGGDVIQPSMVSADFNGDGKPDLGIVGNYIYGGVSILLGNGDGTFTATATNPEVSRGLGMIAVGDFNGDHMADLVVSDYFGPSSTTVLFGKGDGTFTTGNTAVSTDSFAESSLVGDFNGDGKADIAIGFTGGVGIYLGKGDGTFTQPAGSPFSGTGVDLQAGDFNQDGKIDLAAIDTYSHMATILLGAGDGTFTSTPANLEGTLPPGYVTGLVTGDFNLDGATDLAFVSRLGSIASILLTEPTETVNATLTGVAPVGAGTHNVDASYPGDSNYPSAVSATVPLTAGLKPVTITPAGGVFSSVQTVTLAEGIPGATIYYQAYGVFNTSGFIKYTGPIALNIGGQETIIAYATETGYQQSNYTTVAFALNYPTAAAPVLSPASGVYAGAQAVTIADTTPGTTIYYTTDGTTPSTNSTIYAGPIQVSSSGTIAAIAAGGGYSASSVSTAQYFIQSSQTRYIYTAAGDGLWGYAGDGGPAPSAALNEPVNTAVDAAGNLYIADAGNQLVRKVDAATGIISTVAGTGAAGYSGDGDLAAKAQLNYPESLAVDSQGNLYICDLGNYVVRLVDAATGIISTVAGTGKSGTSGDGGAATKAMLGYPQGVALDAAGNLYIDDTVRIRMVNAKTGIITTIAGDGNYGYSGDGGPATSASLSSVEGIAIDKSGNLYLADTYDAIIRKITAATGIITTVAGQNGQNGQGYSGDGGLATSAKLYGPTGVAVDAAGNLYIADTQNYVIREVTAADGKINTIAGHLDACTTLSGDGGPANQSGLCYAPGVTVDNQGNLYVAEEGFNRIRKIIAAAAPPATSTATPVFSISTGSYAAPQTLTITDSTPGAEIYLSLDGSTPRPMGQGYFGPIAITGSATIQALAVAPGYLPSSSTLATYTITAPPTATIQTAAGNGTPTYASYGVPGAQPGFAYPTSVAVDGSHNLYIADPDNAAVWMVSSATGKMTVVAGTPGTYEYPLLPGPAISTALASPQQVAIDAAGNLYIADTGYYEVLRVDAKTGTMTVFAGGGQPTPPSIGDGGQATLASLYPGYLAIDKSGNVYISDQANNRVRKVAIDTGIITTVAGGGTNGMGDGGAATAAALSYPGPIVFDSKGNLYVYDGNNGRVRVVDGKTGIITTFAGNGNRGTTGDGGPALEAEVSAGGLAVDASDNLYLSNSQGGIRKVPAGGGTISTVVGIGYSGYGGDGGSATMAQICEPDGLTFDNAGNLYIADYCNSRVREVSNNNPAATPVFSLAAGTYQGAQTVTITDATQGAAIYYTTDGSTPTSGSTLYSAPVSVSTSETLKAIAVEAGYAVSAVASASYVINLQAIPNVSTVQSSLNPSATGDSVTFSVTVSSNAGSPSGKVTFMDGSTQLGAVTLSGSSATYSTSTLAAGTHSITAVYSGDSNFASVTSSVLSQIVESFSIAVPSGSSSTATASPGGQAAYTLAVTPPATGSALTLSVTGLPAGATGTFSPSTVAAGAGATTVKLTVSVPANAALLREAQPFGGQRWPLTLAVLALAPFARRYRKRWLASLSLLVVMAAGLIAGLGLSGCGGSGKQTSPTQQSYTLTVTATSGTLTESTNLTLTIQ